VIHSIEYAYFKEMFSQDVPIDYILIFDENNDFFRKNTIPSNPMYQTMLLDRMNKIVLIGNPIYNEQLKELYINVINNDKYENN